MRQKMNWININDKLPEAGLNVDLHADNWRSTGWLTKSGLWSIAHAKNVTILSKPTHWAEIKTVGRPKKEAAKKHLGLRLDLDVIAIIRSKPNQVRYIEELVRKDAKPPTHLATPPTTK